MYTRNGTQIEYNGRMVAVAVGEIEAERLIKNLAQHLAETPQFQPWDIVKLTDKGIAECGKHQPAGDWLLIVNPKDGDGDYKCIDAEYDGSAWYFKDDELELVERLSDRRTA